MIMRVVTILLLSISFSSVVAQVDDQARSLFDTALKSLEKGELHESISLFNEVFKKTGAIAALYNASYVKKMMGHDNCDMFEQAIRELEFIVEHYPDYDEAQLSLGFAYLEKGDFDKGWKQHARYLKKAGKNGDALRILLSNNDLAGKTVVLSFEGGLGDSINFIRYADCLKKRGVTVVAMVQKPLALLFSRCPYIDRVVSSADLIPPYHAHATLMSMPAIWWGQPDAMPAEVPYLFPNERLVKKWADFCAQEKALKVGICWQADVFNDSSRPAIARRGIPLRDLLKIVVIDEQQEKLPVHFYSLQKQDGVEQLADVSDDIRITVFDDDFDKKDGSFMDTAALMKSLDLIITIDSAVAHLAGALGRPVWLLLPYASDWRWIKGRDDTPWYPTMRLFRQKSPFDWDSVIQEVRKELQKKMS